jgi:hypothetical protein
MKIKLEKIFKFKKDTEKYKWKNYLRKSIFFIIIYLLLIIFSRHIQTIFTFPAVLYNVQEFN